MDKPVQEFTVKIFLNEDKIEDVKRLNSLIKESVPDLFGNDTLDDTVGFLARSGFGETLRTMLNAYQKS